MSWWEKTQYDCAVNKSSICKNKPTDVELSVGLSCRSNFVDVYMMSKFLLHFFFISFYFFLLIASCGFVYNFSSYFIATWMHNIIFHHIMRTIVWFYIWIFWLQNLNNWLDFSLNSKCGIVRSYMVFVLCIVYMLCMHSNIIKII